MKNFRDFGYDNVKKGILFRAESLHRLSSKDRKLFLDEYKIKVVVDLRTTQERASKMDDELPGVTNLHLPLITMEEMGASSEKEAKKQVIKTHKLPDIHHYYRRLVARERQQSWTRIFELLLEREEGGILFHCTAGKDRTGIVSAIILTVLGINRETILRDYLLTNEHTVFPFAYKVFALTLDKKTRQEFKEYVLAKKEYLDSAFAQIDKTYGSLDGFLQECCGLNEEKIQKLQDMYLIHKEEKA